MDDVDTVLEDLELIFQEIVESFKEELSKIRTGRANVDMLDDITVEYYGETTPLNQVATIRVPEPRLITIQPWEKKMIEPIEKAIMESDLGLNPSNDGSMIRVPIPQLSGERREELVGVAGDLAEDHRIKLRNERREANDVIKKAEDNSEITEDDKHRMFDQVDGLIDEYSDKIDSMLEEKQDKIREV